MQRGPHPSDQATVQALLGIAFHEVPRRRINQGDSDSAAGGGLAAQQLEQPRMGLGQEQHGVGGQVDLALGVHHQGPPPLRGHVGAMGVGGDDLGGGRAAWLLLATLGMRQGELLGLRWTDVDLNEGYIAIRHTLVMVDGKPAMAEPKTAKGRRSLTLAPVQCREVCLPLHGAEERTCLEKRLKKREFINHTGKSPQRTREVKDELRTTIPMGRTFSSPSASLE